MFLIPAEERIVTFECLARKISRMLAFRLCKARFLNIPSFLTTICSGRPFGLTLIEPTHIHSQRSEYAAHIERCFVSANNADGLGAASSPSAASLLRAIEAKAQQWSGGRVAITKLSFIQKAGAHRGKRKRSFENT